ncbi:MAG: TonB family protein [Brevundimonas sp.]|nr:TonB family protein [Brevundimonas sp.]
MFAELAFVVAVSAPIQEPPLRRCYEFPEGCRNSDTYLAGQLPWRGGVGPDVEYPERAHQAQIPGAVVLDCAVSPENGALGGCRIIEETAGNYGFGAAAVRAVSRRRLDPGLWTHERVKFRIDFRF